MQNPIRDIKYKLCMCHAEIQNEKPDSQLYKTTLIK